MFPLFSLLNFFVTGCAPHKFIKKFAAETNFPYDLYCDPERNVYGQLGLLHKLGLGTSKSKHLKMSIAKGLLQSTWRGLKSMALQGIQVHRRYSLISTAASPM